MLIFSMRRLLVVFMFLTASLAAKPIRVAYSYWFAVAPLVIAEHEGYWQKLGLEVELKSFATGQEVAAAITNGEADIGYDMLGTWLDLARTGAPIVIIGETDWSHGGDKLLVRGGKTLASLKGAPLVIYQRSSAVLLFLREALKRENLGIGDFQIVEMSDDAKVKASWIAGKFDAVLYCDPIAADLVEEGGKIVATTADFPGVMPEGFVARRELLAHDGDAVLKKFFSGWFSAVRYLHDPAHGAEVVRLANATQFAGLEPITEEDAATYATTTPVHTETEALLRNDPKKGNAAEFIARIQGLWRQQGRTPAEGALIDCFYLAPILSVAADHSAPSSTP